jgi:general secretion pathway protein F
MPSHRKLAVWYHSLGQSLEAGIPLLAALGAPGGPAPARRSAMVAGLRDGASFEAVLAAEGAWLPAVDVHLLLAGAASGRLPAICRQLAGHHESTARLTGRAVLATLYPLAVIHLGAFALPIQQLVLGTVGAYARQVLLTLVPLWLAIGLVTIPLARHPGLRRRVFRWLPGLSGYQRASDLRVLATVLEGYVAAGFGLETAWVVAGRATGAPGLLALGERLGAEAAAGRRPGARMVLETDLPAEFGQLYRSGEESGKLDESLAWLARRYGEEAERSLTHVSLWYPQVAFLGVAVWVGVKVVEIVAGYFNGILKMMEP